MKIIAKGGLVAASLAIGVLGGTAIAIAGGEQPPPPPPWVNSDGTVDESKLPDKIGVVDNTGQVVRDERGRQVFVDPRAALPQGPGSGDKEPSISVRQNPDGSEQHETRGGRGFRQGKQ